MRGTRSRDAILEAENRQRVDKFETIISVSINIHEKSFMIFEHTINHFSFGYVHLPDLDTIFLFFLYFVIIFSPSSTLNR